MADSTTYQRLLVLLAAFHQGRAEEGGYEVLLTLLSGEAQTEMVERALAELQIPKPALEARDASYWESISSQVLRVDKSIPGDSAPVIQLPGSQGGQKALDPVCSCYRGYYRFKCLPLGP